MSLLGFRLSKPIGLTNSWTRCSKPFEDCWSIPEINLIGGSGGLG
jgi:hypothetical protein